MSAYFPIIMFALLIVFLVVGIPIVYSLGIVAVGTAFFLWGSGSIYGVVTATISTMSNWNLLATPLFTFMSLMLFEAGIVENLYEAFYHLTSKVRGGLAMCTVVVGALMGAMTGVVAGTVIALTTIALPQMLKYKYDKGISMGAVLSGGTLGQLIPPSTVMIVYGTMTGVSIGGLFAGGMSAGIMLAILYCIYIGIRCALNKNLCPTMPAEEQRSFQEMIFGLKKVFWPLVLIVVVLGSIYAGVATPTEASAIGCVGACLIAMLSRRFTFQALLNASTGTLKNTAMVGFITLAASFFGSVFVAIGGNDFVMKLASNIPGGNYGIMLVCLAIVFFLGMFVDTIAIVVICAPIFTPLLAGYGIDPMWFAVCFMVTIQCGYLTPPFGFSLFYMKSAAPEGTELKDIYRSALPFIGVQVVGVLLCVFLPSLMLWGLKIFM